MDQINSICEILSSILRESSNIDEGLIQRIASDKAEIELWREKLRDALTESVIKTMPKSYLEPLFDHIEKIYGILFQEGLLNLPPESDWDGVVPTCLSLAGVRNSLPLGTSGGYFACPRKFSVRGMNYLRDSVKIQSQPALFHLKSAQLLSASPLLRHVAQHINWCALPRNRENNEYLILNYMVPGNPPVNVVFVFVASSEAYKVLSAESSEAIANNEIGVGADEDRKPNASEGDEAADVVTEDPMFSCGWATVLKRFWKGQKEYCDARFKLIPSVEEGPWAIKLAVGTKPALIGTKLQQEYFRGPGYFEVDIDLASSAIAAKILSMVRDVSRTMTVDLAVTLQGNERAELPERILCQARFKGMDFSKALPLAPGEEL